MEEDVSIKAKRGLITPAGDGHNAPLSRKNQDERRGWLMGRKASDLYEVELRHGKCIEPKRAIVLARNEIDAKRKAESLHRGYHATSVQLVPCK